MTSIREVLPARFPETLASDSEASRLQRYASTLPSAPASEALVPTPTLNTSSALPSWWFFRCLAKRSTMPPRGEIGLNFFDARGKLLNRLSICAISACRHATLRALAWLACRHRPRRAAGDRWPIPGRALWHRLLRRAISCVLARAGGGAGRLRRQGTSIVAQLRRQNRGGRRPRAPLAPDDLVGFAQAAAAGNMGALHRADVALRCPAGSAGAELQPLSAGERAAISSSPRAAFARLWKCRYPHRTGAHG